MNWTNLFRSRYVRFLEEELNAERKKHAEELARINSAHAEERTRCINEANRGWAEADRLRQYLIPGLPAANRTPSPTDNEPVAEKEEFSGTPFQKMAARSMKEQEAEYKRREAERKLKEQFPTPKEPVPAAS